VDELPVMRLWRLDRIVSIDLLDRGFARREGFDLSAYAGSRSGYSRRSRSTWCCGSRPRRLMNAAGWLFHPSQGIERDRSMSTPRFLSG
jgi:hypothetical protein